LPLLILILGGLLALLGGCREIPSDRLYALYLDHPPTRSDWERALPRLVTVRGGQLHKRVSLADIDNDTVHVTTASCHHGASLPDPVAVAVRAFYTDSDLYLELSWEDATRDDRMKQCRYDGELWQNSQALEDGFGILWDASDSFRDFSCSYACHIDNFGVSKANFHATNRMKLVRDDAWLDLWNWKAQRTNRYGFADDRYLDSEGMHGDLPGELFRPNSRYFVAGDDPSAFSEGDAPLYDNDGEAVENRFIPVDTRAPGYITERPLGGRSDIVANGVWSEGRWRVMLRRALTSGDPHDVDFAAHGEKGITFGLSLMDNTLREHYASNTREQLVLLPRSRSQISR